MQVQIRIWIGASWQSGIQNTTITRLFPKLLFLQLHKEKGSWRKGQLIWLRSTFQVLLPLAMLICLITIKLATWQMTNGPWTKCTNKTFHKKGLPNILNYFLIQMDDKNWILRKKNASFGQLLHMVHWYKLQSNRENHSWLRAIS